MCSGSQCSNSAAWTPLASAGGPIIGNPSCAQLGAFSSVICAAKDIDSHLIIIRCLVNISGPDCSSGFVRVPDPPVVGDPSCGTTFFSVVCAAREATRDFSGLYVFSCDRQACIPYVTVQGLFIGTPSCAGVGTTAGISPTEVVCAIKKTNSQLFVTQCTSNSISTTLFCRSSSTLPLSTSIIGGPSCASATVMATSLHAVCGVIGGADSALSITQYSFPGWGPFQPRGGTIIGSPSCAGVVGTSSSVRAICSVIGTNGELYVFQFNGTTWGGFTEIGSTIIEEPSCVSSSFAGLVKFACAVIGTDSRLYVTVGP